jgi:uncharacterized protein YkwD
MKITSFKTLALIISVFILLSIILFVSYNYYSSEKKIHDDFYNSFCTQDVADSFGPLFDQYRESKGLPKLAWNRDLYCSSLYSAYLIETGKRDWSHKGYIKDITRFYKSPVMVGENLATDFDNEQAVFKAWLDSPRHNDVLLNAKVCEYGFAQYKNTYVLHIACTERK